MKSVTRETLHPSQMGRLHVFFSLINKASSVNVRGHMRLMLLYLLSPMTVTVKEQLAWFPERSVAM